jgi:hypothetical protein
MPACREWGGMAQGLGYTTPFIANQLNDQFGP